MAPDPEERDNYYLLGTANQGILALVDDADDALFERLEDSCEPALAGWQPVRVQSVAGEHQRKPAPLGDHVAFVGLMTAMSVRSRTLLGEIFGSDAEFLPLALSDGRSYFALHVLTEVPTCSGNAAGAQPLMNLYALRRDLRGHAIFRAGVWRCVTPRVVELVEEHALKGFSFVRATR